MNQYFYTGLHASISSFHRHKLFTRVSRIIIDFYVCLKHILCPNKYQCRFVTLILLLILFWFSLTSLRSYPCWNKLAVYQCITLVSRHFQPTAQIWIFVTVKLQALWSLSRVDQYASSYLPVTRNKAGLFEFLSPSVILFCIILPLSYFFCSYI